MAAMDSDALRDRWHGLARWLDATPSEVAGLVVLLVGALAVVGVLWWSGRPVPVAGGPAPGAASPTPGGVPTGDGGLVGADTVTVHVAGAVSRPGLVRLPVGARVADAVAAAGGLVVDADADGLNLARTVEDGERLAVPRVGEASVGGAAAASGPPADDAHRPDGTLDLNRATAADLEELPGVGPVLAGRILDWREAHGPFTAVGQLREVAGIGEKTFQSLAPLVAT
jgi:competence protein ComEA